MQTCEKRVFDRIFNILSSRRETVVIHGGNPPGGKSYLVRNLIIKIPDLPKTRHSRIDLIYQIGSILVLTELKCRLSEASDDISKLRTIRDTTSIENLIHMLEAQGVFFDTAPEKLLLSIGVEIFDTSPPDDFVVVVAEESKYSLIEGSAVNEEEAIAMKLVLFSEKD